MKRNLIEIAKSSLPVMFITEVAASVPELISSVVIALDAGLRVIQYREKHLNRKEMTLRALALRELTLKYDAILIINDYPDIALCVDADGVHLGQDDIFISDIKGIFADKIIGISTHNMHEALEAQDRGADYVGFGSIFATATKDVSVIQGVDAIRALKNAVSIPIVAIGGITDKTVKEVITHGADLVAISSFISKGNVRENITKIAQALKL